MASRVRIGSVPARALNLPLEVMKDGYYNLITYAVTEELARNETMYNSMDGGTISVVDETSTSVVTPPGYAAWVLISHGESGRGAIPFGGSVVVSTCPAETDAYDAENCNFSNTNGTFRTAVYSNANNPAHFDDIVKYATKIAPAAGPSSGGGDLLMLYGCPVPSCPTGYHELYKGVSWASGAGGAFFATYPCTPLPSVNNLVMRRAASAAGTEDAFPVKCYNSSSTLYGNGSSCIACAPD